MSSTNETLTSNKGTNMNRHALKSLILLPIVAASFLVASCNQAGPTIERVQTNLVDKGIFEGEWWVTQTMIDIDSDASAMGVFSFDGAMSWSDLGVDKGRSGSMARIRWVIDENYLFAYRAYELIRGGNDDGDDPDFRGQPLAAFAIESHLDVRADYNDITGEKSNVIIENTDDRRWYEREFMRVDWSENHVQSFYFLDDVQALGGYTREPMSFDIERLSHLSQFPERYTPEFVRVAEDPGYRFRDEWPAGSEDTVHYMSFVNMSLLSPGPNCRIFIGGGPAACQTFSVPIRTSFLRVPPNHEYAAATQTHDEFDRFGLFRTYQRTYIRGGENQDVNARHCTADAHCGPGGKCDTERELCVGGLTEDYGETDFLAFYRPRYNMFRNHFQKGGDGEHVTCRADWQCPDEGSVCDPAAGRCTVPLQEREPRQVTYHLNSGYPRHLVDAAFEVIGNWNKVFMKGWRAARGEPIPDYGAAEVACQDVDPTQYCFCDSPEANGGSCRAQYDPFVSPSEWADRGVTAPYDCQVQPADGYTPPEHPTSYEDYPVPDVYNYEFVGDECMLVLESNSCDKARTDPSVSCDMLAKQIREEEQQCETSAECGAGQTCVPGDGGGRCELRWEQLGDIRYQFFNYIDHVNTYFGGVALPLVDPLTGELITSNSNMAGPSIESVGTLALEYFPVLRGEVPEDHYIKGENIRGYFDRLGYTEHPVSMAPSGTDGYSVDDTSRPAIPIDFGDRLREHMSDRLEYLEQFRGPEGRSKIMSDRLRELAGTPKEKRLVRSIGPDGRDLLKRMIDPRDLDPSVQSVDNDVMDKVSPFRGNFKKTIDERLERIHKLGMYNIYPAAEDLFKDREWEYFADRFAGRPGEEASIRVQQAFLRAVMNHELGHSVGLRHNFGGSIDRDNYHDAYFDIVVGDPSDHGDNRGLPDIGSYDEDADGFVSGEEYNRYVEDLRRVRNERSEQGIGNTMTASTMDYNGDLSDVVYGLGKYDEAATIWNYFDQIEAYDGDPRISSGDTLDGLAESRETKRQWWSYYRGGESCQITAEDPGRARRQVNRNAACPYARESELLSDGQPFHQRCIKHPRRTTLPVPCETGDSNCICSSFEEDFGDYQDGVAFRSSDEPLQYWPVDYLYCNDERTMDISWCSRFDAGESFTEIIDHYRRSWEEGYPLQYFRRFRNTSFLGAGAVMSMRDAAKIFQHLFFRLYYESGFFSDTGPLGFENQFLATVDAMHWFIEMVNLPDTGSYSCNPDRNVCRKISDVMDAPGATFSLHPGAGFDMWSQYQEGHYGFFREEQAGVFFDKLYALFALTNRDWSLQFTIDETFFINFYDLFPVEMAEFFGGLVQRDPTWFAPRVRMEEGEPRITHMSWFRGTQGVFGSCRGPDGSLHPCRGSQPEVYPVGDMGGTNQFALEDTTNEILRDYATLFALSQFPVFFNTRFEQQLSIFKLDNGDGHTIPGLDDEGGTPCAYGAFPLDDSHDTDCSAEDADYVVYQSDRFHTPYIAVKVRSRITYNLEEEQLGFQLLRGVVDNQERIQELEAIGSPSDSELEELRTLQDELHRDESFLEYLIEVQRTFGISSYL